MGLQGVALHVSRDQNHLVWDPAIPAVATVGSGEVVELDCLDASFGQLNAESTDANLATLDFDRVDQVTGPGPRTPLRGDPWPWDGPRGRRTIAAWTRSSCSRRGSTPSRS